MNPNPSLSEIEAALIKEAASLLPDAPSQITRDTPLHDLGLDSLRLFELFVFIEKEFALSLLDAPVTRANLESIGALARHISNRLHA
jgi:acyl carrier protein